MLVAGVHHVAVQVADVDRVARFYVEVLGLPELRRFHREDGSLRSVWVALDSTPRPEGAFLAVEHLPEGLHGVRGFSMLGLRIAPDARAPLISRLSALGVDIEKQTGWTFYVRDPEGNLVGLSHHPHDAAGGTGDAQAR